MAERPEPIMLRPVTVAALLDMSVSAVYRKMDNGEIPSVRFGRSRRVPRRWVDEQAAVA